MGVPDLLFLLPGFTPVGRIGDNLGGFQNGHWVAVVPEPMSLSVVGIGLSAFVLFRRR
jgi:hypothetical protein